MRVLQLVVFVTFCLAQAHAGNLEGEAAYTACLSPGAGCTTLGVSSLTGTIPTEVGTLTDLTAMDWLSNSFTGPLPTEIGALTNLESLQLDSSGLTGTLPTQLGELTALTFLKIDGTGIGGKVPTELGALTDLTMLRLKENSLTGSIPSQLALMASIQKIAMDTNSLTGTLPKEFANLAALTDLEVDANSLTGTLPSSYRKITTLKELSLWGNNFMSTIPSAYADLTALTSFKVMLNALLCGEVPDGVTLVGNTDYPNPTQGTALGDSCPSPPPASPSPPPPVNKPPRPVLSFEDVRELTAKSRELIPGRNNAVKPGMPGSGVEQDTNPDGHQCPPGYHVMGDHRGGRNMGKKSYYCMKNEKMFKMADFQNTLDPNGVNTAKKDRGWSTQKSMNKARVVAESNNVDHRTTTDSVRDTVASTRTRIANMHRSRLNAVKAAG